ncbi:MAG: hypothetical protein ACTHM9_08700 [Gemmatimonadales bacterium]
MALLERWLWLYVQYFAAVLAGGATLAMVTYLVYCLMTWCRRRRP